MLQLKKYKEISADAIHLMKFEPGIILMFLLDVGQEGSQSSRSVVLPLAQNSQEFTSIFNEVVGPMLIKKRHC